VVFGSPGSFVAVVKEHSFARFLGILHLVDEGANFLRDAIGESAFPYLASRVAGHALSNDLASGISVFGNLDLIVLRDQLVQVDRPNGSTLGVAMTGGGLHGQEHL
jgi:hypothetical protein